MKYNYVGIDTSLSSTGLYILKANGEEFYYNYKNTDKLTKWHRTLSFVEYRDYEVLKLDGFSNNEIGKIIKYGQVTDQIIKDILKHCKPEETYVSTENYSYSSQAGKLIDLVCYGTLVREKLIKLNFIDFTVVPPTSLKAKICIMVYGPGEKKKPSKNDQGISGGKFKKHEILRALFHSKKESKLVSILEFHRSELLLLKSIPAPISDIVDAMFLVYTDIINRNDI